MRAEIVAVGTEILLGQIVDSNSAELGQMLAPLGITHTHRQSVGDNVDRLVEALKLALSRADIVFTIGGLGPTVDDLTRDGIALALDDPLIHDEALEQHLRVLWVKRNLPWADTQLRQAQRPSCGDPIANPNGTAPGLICQKDGKVIIAMPGPPGEFIPMMNGPVREFLQYLGDGRVIHSRVLKVTGMGETIVEKRLGEWMDATNPTLAPYAKPGEVHLRLTAMADSVEQAEALMAPVEAKVHELLGPAVFGTDDQTLESVVLDLLAEKGMKLAVAESCTGGELGARITEVPGATRAFLGGIVSYADEIKMSLLGVSKETIDKHGAVSEETAREMAIGVRDKLGADYGLSITGIAGPDGGTPEKPVGLVYMGMATPDEVKVERTQFIGIRATVRRRSTQQVLTMLYHALLKTR